VDFRTRQAGIRILEVQAMGVLACHEDLGSIPAPHTHNPRGAV
jgi:hypothetical protein